VYKRGRVPRGEPGSTNDNFQHGELHYVYLFCMCVWSVKAASAPFQTARDESNWVSSECHIAEHRVVDLTPHGSGWLYAQTRWNCCFSLPDS